MCSQSLYHRDLKKGAVYNRNRLLRYKAVTGLYASERVVIVSSANRTVEKIGSRCFIDSLYSESSYRGGRFGRSYVMMCVNSARDIVIRVFKADGL